MPIKRNLRNKYQVSSAFDKSWNGGCETINISGKNIIIKNIDGPIGVNGRNSDNTLYEEKMGWSVSKPLINGMEKTFEWVNTMVHG